MAVPKVVFVVKNKHNKGSRVMARLDQACLQAGLGPVWFLPTLHKGHAVSLARQATVEGCSMLIAVGGDGTLSEVVNGVLKSRIPANLHPAIGLFPLGTGNDFARSVGITPSLEALIDTLTNPKPRRIDVGRITLEDEEETRYFLNVSGLGLGPEVVRGMERAKGVLGPQLGYFLHILKGFLSYSKKKVRCTAADWQWEGQLLQMAVGNGRYFGNGICVAPEARLDDGQFHISIFGNLSLLDYIKNLGRLKRGARIMHTEVHYRTAPEIRIESPDCGIEADGEYAGLAPATLSVLPGAIRFIGSRERG